MESIIIENPILWLGYGIALFFCVYDLIKKATGYIFPVLSLIFFFATTTYAVLLGAPLYEIGTVMLIFLTLNFASFFKHNGNDKNKGDK